MRGRLLGIAGLLLIAGIAVVLLGRGGADQPARVAMHRGQAWSGSPGVRESVASIAARGRAEDRRQAGRPQRIRIKPEPGEQAAGKQPTTSGAGGSEERSRSTGEEGIRQKPEPGEGTQPKRQGPAARQQRVGAAAIAPESSFSTGTSFLGAQVSESHFVPPDSMGSVGPDQVVVDVNGRIKVFDRQGNLGGLNVTDDAFWNSVCSCTDTIDPPTDPGVEYDRLSGRWIISAVNTASSDNRVMIAVSSGSHITDQSSFSFFQFSQNIGGGDNGQFADYPQLGVDKNAIYIGVNNFLSSFTHTNVFVINKASVLGGGPIVVTPFRNLTSGSSGPGPDSPQPATDMDPNVNEGYIVGPDNQLFNRIDVMRITNPGAVPPSAPSISGILTVPVPSTTFPLSVPASGSHKNLDALDDRLFEAMIGRDPSGTVSLWTAHNIEVNSSGVGTSGGDRDGDRWYQVGNLSTTPTLLQSGTLFDAAASNPRFFWMPSIAMNGQGHASLNSSMAGPGRFAEVASSGRLATDPSGTTEPFDNTQSSSSSYDIGQQGQILRWGDYSQTVVDPNDNMTFWTFQEYANANNSWGVQVIKLRPPPPATPTAASPNTIASGQTSVSVQVIGTQVNGSGFFDPGTGYPNHIDASVSGGVTVNSVTYTDPSHVTLDLNTVGASNGSQDVTITNPDGQSTTGANVLVVNSDVTPPAPPTLLGSTPSSPANNNAPKLFGGAEGNSTVKLYASGNCTGSVVASDSQLTFASIGIPVSVAVNSSTTFSATATDLSNNTSDCSSTLASHGTLTYVEDSSAPQITIDSGPSGATADTTPTFAFHATDSFPPGDTIGFKCSVDTGIPAFSACSGPGNSDTPPSPLAVGSYRFRVQATDAAGNSSLATRSFTVKAPPDTTITKGPKKKTTKRRPKFKFTSTEPGGTFDCSLDGGKFAPCASPFKPSAKLRFGKHVLKVRSIDSAGIPDPTPAVRKFKVIA
jgi:hypothetical protein